MKEEAEETLSLLPPPGISPPPPVPTPVPTPAAAPATRTGMPIREDCWSEEASCTLVEAWGERYLELNRGNLRQKHWQLVADTVNNRHANANNSNNNNKRSSKRTDVQCKNRIDTLKKKYKLEKARVLSSDGTYKSNWPLYDQLDALIGTTIQSKKMMIISSQPTPTPTPPQLTLPYYTHRKVQATSSLPHTMFVPLQMRRPQPPPAGYVPTGIDESSFRRNYSAVAAAAAAAADDVGRGNSDSSRSSEESNRGAGDGFGELAKAISTFADIYERVEGARQRQMMELEKERMELMKSLEYQRMQLFMDSQVQLEKIKRAKHDASASSD